MRKISEKVSIVVLVVVILFSVILSTGQAEAEPELTIDSNLRYLFGTGGGEITVTVQGELAADLRENILEDDIFNPSDQTVISKTISVDFGESFEDILEMRINPNRSRNDTDATTAGVDYKGIFKFVQIKDPGRVDIKSIEGLEGTNSTDTSKFTLKMDIKGKLAEDSEMVLSDGYIILYGLWGEEIPILAIDTYDVHETGSIFVIGMNSFSDQKLDAGGKVTHYRLIMGDYFEYENDYKLNGYELEDKKKDTVHFDSFNIVENSLVLFLLILILTIIAAVVTNKIIKKNMVEKVLLTRIIGIVFFIILAIFYLIGINGILVWCMSILFFVVNVVLGYGIYQKGWAKIAKVTLRHEDFLKKPPKIEKGPWHERGIANAKVGNFNEALNCFENALEAEPDNAIIWNDLGFVHRKVGNYRLAIECFNKALELRPNYTTASENLEKSKLEMQAQASRKKK